MPKFGTQTGASPAREPSSGSLTHQLPAESLRRLVHISARLLAQPDLESLLPVVLDIAGELVAADAYALWRHVAREDSWKIVASRGLSRTYREQSLPGSGAEMPTTPIIVEDVSATPALLEARRALYRVEGIQALVVVPLAFEGKSTGSLGFYFRAPRRLAESEIAMISVFADFAAGAIAAAERHQAHIDQQRRSEFLAEASKVLSSSLNYERTLQSVARLAVPHIADACVVDVLENDGHVRRVAMEHPDRRKVQAATEFARKSGGDIEGDHALGRVIRTGRTEFYSPISDQDLIASARDEEHLELLRAMQMCSSLIVPLKAHGRVLGALTLATTAESGRRLWEADVAVAEELAASAAVAIDNARLHRELEHSQKGLELAQHAAGAWSWEIDLATGRVSRSRPPTASNDSPLFTQGGDTLDEVVAQLHPEDRQRALAALREASQNAAAEHEIEYRVVLPDGGIRWVYVRGRRVDENGERPRLVGIAMDITSRKQVEAELRKTQEERERSITLLSAFVTSAPVGFALHDPQGRIIDINPYLAELNGIPREQHFGRTVHEVIPGIAQKVSEAIQQVIATSAPISAEIEGDTIDPDRPRWWMSSYFPVKSASGSVMAVGAAVMDVTERKLAARAAQERGYKLEILTKASQRIHAELNLPTIMRVLVSSAAALVEAEHGAWTMQNERGPRVAEVLMDGEHWMPMPAEFGFSGAEAVDTVQPRICHAPAGNDWLPGGSKLRNFVTVPIIGRTGRPLGSLELYNKTRQRTFDFTDVELLQGLAASAAVAIENGRLYQDAQTERARLHAVLTNLPLGIIIVEAPSGKLLIANKMAERLWQAPAPDGCTIEQYRPQEATHSDGRKYTLEEFPSFRALRGEVVNSEELETTRPDGRRVIFRVSAAPVRLPSGATIAAVVVFDDVTDHRQAERALALANERLVRAQEAGKIVSWELEVATGAIDWSNAEELYGADLPRDLNSFVAMVHREDRDSIRDLQRKLNSEGWATEEFRICVRGQDPRWTSLRAQLYRSAAGDPQRVVGTIVDVTDRKAAEEIMRKTEKLAAMGRLAATIAHEINNPLEAVTNLLYLLRRSGLNPQGAELLGTAEQELSRVSHIVKQTLGFYRDTSAPVTTTLGEITDEVLSLYAPKLQSKAIAVEKHYKGEPQIRVLRGEVRQVLSNLISNAIDSVEGPGKISVRIAKVEAESGPAVQVIVRDDGAGIPAEQQSRLFEPFFTTKKESGTGLGLWVSRGLIEKHGGAISVESSTDKESHGTTFIVTLPVASRLS